MSTPTATRASVIRSPTHPFDSPVHERSIRRIVSSAVGAAAGGAGSSRRRARSAQLRGEDGFGRVDDALHREHQLVRGRDEVLGGLGLHLLERVHQPGERPQRVGPARSPRPRAARRPAPRGSRSASCSKNGFRPGDPGITHRHQTPTSTNSTSSRSPSSRAAADARGAAGCRAARSPGGAGPTATSSSPLRRPSSTSCFSVNGRCIESTSASAGGLDPERLDVDEPRRGTLLAVDAPGELVEPVAAEQLVRRPARR